MPTCELLGQLASSIFLRALALLGGKGEIPKVPVFEHVGVLENRHFKKFPAPGGGVRGGGKPTTNKRVSLSTFQPGHNKKPVQGNRFL